jgi:hypothetical protein
MVTLRAFLALLAGFVATTILQIAIAAALKRWTPDWAEADHKADRLRAARLRIGGMMVHLGGAFLAAAAGGYVIAWGAAEKPLAYVLALGVILLVLAGLSSVERREELPAWFLLARVAIAPVGVLAGGLVRLRVSGVLP